MLVVVVGKETLVGKEMLVGSDVVVGMPGKPVGNGKPAGKEKLGKEKVGKTKPGRRSSAAWLSPMARVERRIGMSLIVVGSQTEGCDDCSGRRSGKFFGSIEAPDTNFKIE